jgi:hypothetical protein
MTEELPDGYVAYAGNPITICRYCEHYLAMSLDNHHCSMAKLIAINPVNGHGAWERNSDKNRGSCPDYVRRVEPKPEEMRRQFEQAYAPKRSAFMEWALGIAGRKQR